MERLTRYMLRPPLSLERVQYPGGIDEVVYARKGSSGRPGQEERFDALDFLARVIAHIPESRTHLIRYPTTRTWRAVVGGTGKRNPQRPDMQERMKASGICYAVVRPTGYLSDMVEVLEMARKGRIWLVGSGENRTNPIHGADLAVACVDAMEDYEIEIDVGGPEIMTWNEVAALAFEVLGRPPKVTHIPPRLMWSVVRLVRLFNQHQGDVLAFFTTMATTDVVAPSTGTHTLETHFRELGAGS